MNCYHSEERLETHRNSWMCNVHYVRGKKSNDKLSQDSVPTIFDHIVSLLKRKAKLISVIGFLCQKYSLQESTFPLKVHVNRIFFLRFIKQILNYYVCRVIVHAH